MLNTSQPGSVLEWRSYYFYLSVITTGDSVHWEFKDRGIHYHRGNYLPTIVLKRLITTGVSVNGTATLNTGITSLGIAYNRTHFMGLDMGPDGGFLWVSLVAGLRGICRCGVIISSSVC